MNAQEIFNEAYKRIVAQGRPATIKRNPEEDDGFYNCAYQTPDGRNCGVGILMNEEELAEYGNDKGNIIILLRRDRSRRVLRPFFARNAPLLIGLQRAHDDASKHEDFVGAFKKGMAYVAHQYDLEVPDGDD